MLLMQGTKEEKKSSFSLIVLVKNTGKRVPKLILGAKTEKLGNKEIRPRSDCA